MDDFIRPKLGLQWQWQAAPNAAWYNLQAKPGSIRLHAVAAPTDNGSLFYAGNLLLQKFMAPAFTATTQLQVHALAAGDRAGLAIVGTYYTSLCLEKTETGYRIVLYEGKRQDRKYLMPQELVSMAATVNKIWLKVQVKEDATCSYTYSIDGKMYQSIGTTYKAEKGGWIGAKAGIFCVSPNILKSIGYADFDFFTVEK